MGGFERFESALRGRDVLERLIRNVINRERPRPRYGEVLEISRTHSRCLVRLNGDTTSVLIPMGAVQPTSVGQVVRVEGVGTDRYITDVIGGSAQIVHQSPTPLVRAYGVGSYTWTKPVGLSYVRVRVQAGGGAGGGRANISNTASIGSGGGGGGYCEGVVHADNIPETVPIVVGSGGGGVTGGTGNSGGDSYFGPQSTGHRLFAQGGAGGVVTNSALGSNSSGAVAPGGTAATGGSVRMAISIGGQSGLRSWYFGALHNSAMMPGDGGGAMFGAGGLAPGMGQTGVANSGGGRGGGGSGMCGLGQSAAGGGTGAPGWVIVEEYFL